MAEPSSGFRVPVQTVNRASTRRPDRKLPRQVDNSKVEDKTGQAHSIPLCRSGEIKHAVLPEQGEGPLGRTGNQFTHLTL